MTFALIVASAVAITFALRQWQEVEMTAARWELYRLRDALRAELLSRTRDGRPTDLFEELDDSITALCAGCQARAISLYMFGFGILFADHESRQRSQLFIERLHRPENSTLRAIYDASILQVLRVLLWRHAVLVAIVAPTLVGLGLISVAMYNAAARMLAHAPDPAAKRLIAGAAAT